MKMLLKLAGTGLAGSLVLGAISAKATLEIDASVQINARADFEMPLASSGAWVEVGSYGRCWHPSGVAVEWRPYCEGQWVWTDCGWYWESDEPWAWACYHYGSWVSDPSLGWCWVPGVEWAPAWVEWRVGGGFIGWAPCAPVGVVIAPAFFGFVEIGHFNERLRPQTVIVNNTTIINKTTVINNIKQETRTVGGSSRKVVVNEGPGVDVIQKASGKTISAVPIQQAARHTSVPAGVMHKPEQPANGEQAPCNPRQSEKPTPNETPNSKQGPSKGVEQPRSEPKTERPPRENPERPGKSITITPNSPAPSERPAPPAERRNPITPNSPAPKERPLPPGERGNRGSEVRPEEPGRASPTRPVKPEEPGRGGGGQSQPKEKQEGHD